MIIVIFDSVIISKTDNHWKLITKQSINMNVKQKMGMAFGVMAMALAPSALMAQND